MKLHMTTAAILFALATTACASTQDESAAPAAAAAQAPAPQPAPAAEPAAPPVDSAQAPAPAGQAWTDDQLRAFLAANDELAAVAAQHQAGLQGTPEQQQAAREAIRAAAGPILERHSLTVETYNALSAQVQTDVELRRRLADLRGITPAAAPDSGDSTQGE